MSVPITVATSHDFGGKANTTVNGGHKEAEPERDAKDGPWQRREHLGNDQPGGHLSGSGAERTHKRRGMSSVEHRCPGREEGVQDGQVRA